MSKVMYRSEACYGSGVRDAAKVVAYELFELGNTDILDHLLSGILSQSPRKDDFIRLRFQIETQGELIDLTEHEKIEVAQKILDAIKAETGKSVKYALWLASKDAVKTFYDGKDGEIDAYLVSDTILSDLGEDGKLFGYTEMPEKVNK